MDFDRRSQVWRTEPSDCKAAMVTVIASTVCKHITIDNICDLKMPSVLWLINVKTRFPRANAQDSQKSSFTVPKLTQTMTRNGQHVLKITEFAQNVPPCSCNLNETYKCLRSCQHNLDYFGTVTPIFLDVAISRLPYFTRVHIRLMRNHSDCST